MGQGFDIAKEAVNIINANLIVYEDFEGHLDSEWYDLMSSFEAYQFTMQPKSFDVNQTWQWAQKAVFPTMAFLRKDNQKKYEAFMREAVLPKRHAQYLKMKKQNQGKKKE